MAGRRWGLNTRIAAALLALGLAMLAVLAVHRSRLDRIEAEEAARAVGLRKAQKLSETLVSPLYELSMPSVESAVRGEFDDPAVVQIAVYEDPEKPPLAVFRREGEAVEKASELRSHPMDLRFDFSVTRQAPGSGGEVLGAVSVWTCPEQALSAMAGRTRRRLLEESLVILVLVAAAFLALRRLVVVPIGRVTAALERTAESVRMEEDLGTVAEELHRSLRSVRGGSLEYERLLHGIQALVAALVRRQNELERILQTVLGTLSVVDARTQEVKFANDEWREKLGMCAVEGRLRDDWIERFVHPEDHATVLGAFQQVLERRVQAGPYVTRQILEDGSVRWWRWIAAPLDIDERGEVLLEMKHALDITDLRRLQEELERANTVLEETVEERTRELVAANRELESFAYSVSHDLRAPLRAINGFGQILIEDYSDKLDEEGLNCVRRMVAAADRLGQLVDALLHLSRVTRAEVRRQPLGFGALVAELMAELREESPERHVEVHVEPGLTVNADPVLTRSLLQNLLSNAWKYTRGNPDARIEIGSCTVDGRPGFFVRDNGVGFDASQLEKAMKPFQRLHSEKEFEGLGVGLATVQRIVARHGGKIEAVSAPGEGAEFRVTLEPGPPGPKG
ncbi:MAG: sensor histidine kinase [Fimbriimonadaceae bacterium]